jgi:hypothetical protein
MKTLLVMLLLAAPAAIAQEETADAAAASPPPPKPCSSEGYRQFDFWVGSWDVTANGKPAGHNEIARVHGGCALAENWVSAGGGFTGSSLNIYDRASDQWHQTWVDTAGTLLQLDGGMADGEMVLEGQRPGPDGALVKHRITWTPNTDGSVRQHWQTTTDGENWTTIFDGLYVRVEGSE